MGLCNQVQSSPNLNELAPQDARTHKQIEQHMSLVKKSENQVRKLLLLGAGSSGKSTLFRQLKCVYKDGFDDDVLEDHVPIIRRNCVSGMLVLLKKSQTLYELDSKENADCFIDVAALNNENKSHPIVLGIQTVVNFVKDTFDGYENDTKFQEYRNKNDNDDTIDEYLETRIQKAKDGLYELGQALKILWALPQIQATYTKRRIYQYSLPDNRQWFFDQIETIFNWGYQPTQQDMLKCRIRTTGIGMEERYETKDSAFTITDVGGQRNERRKWINKFEGVTAVIFVAALNHYAAVLFEDEGKNAMIESIELFCEIINAKWFKRTEMILFLNKDDLFQECILADVPLSLCFNEKNGCIWKKEYVDDRNYYPKNKKESIKMYNTLHVEYKGDADSAQLTVNNTPAVQSKNSDDESEKKRDRHRVNNESESISFSSSGRISAEEYARRAAIYPKVNLRFKAKSTYENGRWQNKTDVEWFNFIYMDMLHFITEQYNSMNQHRGTKRIFVHVTTATDADNVSKVFWDVQNIVIRSNLSRGGLL